MSIFNYNAYVVGEQITPPDLRKPKFMAWLDVLLKPLQWAADNLFVDFSNGSNYPEYDGLTGYSFGDTVIWSDKRVYKYISTTITAGTDPSNDAYWTLVNETFIGVNEQVKYNSQIIVFEYHLNKYFLVSPINPQIYLSDNANSGSNFMMGFTGPYSDNMPVNSAYQINYMSTIPAYTLTDFTINVPLTLFNSLGNTSANSEKAIRNYADKFVLSGMCYDVSTY